MERQEKFFGVFGEDVTAAVSGDTPDPKLRIALESAVLFAERGFDVISIRDIADEVGVQASSLYNHYPSKHSMLQTILIMVEEVYFCYLHGLRDRAKKAVCFSDGLEAVVTNPRKSLNKLSSYGISLVHCEKFRSDRSASIYTDIFITYSVNLIQKIFLDYIGAGICRPFDAHIAAVVVNNFFHTSVNMLMQEYLGLQPYQDLDPMVGGVRNFLLDLGVDKPIHVATRPKAIKRAWPVMLEDVLPLRSVPPMTAEAEENRLASVHEAIAAFHKDRGLPLGERIADFLRVYEAQQTLLPKLKLVQEAEAVFRSFTESYLESTMTSQDDPRQHPEVTALIDLEVERWEKSRARAAEMVKGSESLARDITSIIERWFQKSQKPEAQKSSAATLPPSQTSEPQRALRRFNGVDGNGRDHTVKSEQSPGGGNGRDHAAKSEREPGDGNGRSHDHLGVQAPDVIELGLSRGDGQSQRGVDGLGEAVGIGLAKGRYPKNPYGIRGNTKSTRSGRKVAADKPRAVQLKRLQLDQEALD